MNARKIAIVCFLFYHVRARQNDIKQIAEKGVRHGKHGNLKGPQRTTNLSG